MGRFIRFIFRIKDYKDHKAERVSYSGKFYSTERAKLLAGRNYLFSSIAIWETSKGNHFITRDYIFSKINIDIDISPPEFKVTLFNVDKNIFLERYCLDENIEP